MHKLCANFSPRNFSSAADPAGVYAKQHKTRKKIRETRSKLTSADKRHPRSKMRSAAAACRPRLAAPSQSLIGAHRNFAPNFNGISLSRDTESCSCVDRISTASKHFVYLVGRKWAAIIDLGCVKLHFDPPMLCIKCAREEYNEFHNAALKLV